VVVYLDAAEEAEDVQDEIAHEDERALACVVALVLPVVVLMEGHWSRLLWTEALDGLVWLVKHHL